MASAVAVLNEMSWPDQAEESDLPGKVIQLARVVRDARKIRSDLGLVLPTDTESRIVTADGLSLSSAAQRLGGSTLDAWRLVRSVSDRSPLGEPAASDVEYRIDGQVCHALGVAHRSAQIAFSFIGSPVWEDTSVEVVRLELIEADEGAVFEESLVSVLHASTSEHVEHHRNSLLGMVLPGQTSLWSARALRFPNLTFLPRVETQLRSYILDPQSLAQIELRLEELNSAVGGWDPSTGSGPDWQSYVTFESQSRKELTRFPDEDGLTHLFEEHARFTPGAGRIYFRRIVIDGNPTLRVAHIGLKL